VTTDGKRISRRVCRQKSGHNSVMLVLLENEEFCEVPQFSLTIYAVVCSNVVVHLSDHNRVMVAQVGYYTPPLSLLNYSALALFAQRTRIPTSARSIGFCAIWVCISSSSSSMIHDTPIKRSKTYSFCTPSVPLT